MEPAATRTYPHLLPDRSAGLDVSLLDRLAVLAARRLGAPAGRPSLVADVQSILAPPGQVEGATGTRGAVADSLSAIVVATGAPLVVPQAVRDERVAHLPPRDLQALGFTSECC